MGGVPSTPRWSNSRPQETAEYLIGTFVGEKSFPLSSEYWQQLLELPFDVHWPSHRVHEACVIFAQNNCVTRHLAKILIHLSWCLQDLVTASDVPSLSVTKAINALHISSVFLKYLIENAKSNTFEELYLAVNDTATPPPNNFPRDQSIEQFVMHSVLSFMGSVDVSSETYLLHHELLNFMLVTMSTQLLSGPSPGPYDPHPFIDAAMVQQKYIVGLVVRRLLLNYIARPQFPSNTASYAIFAEGNQPGVLERVGSAAANLVLLPFSFFVSSSGETLRSPLAESSINVLLTLIHFRKCVVLKHGNYEFDDSANSNSLLKEETCFSENPYCKALENARDIEFDRADIEGNAQAGPSIPFAPLFDTLGMSLGDDEGAVLLLYSLIHGNADFLEYVLVRTDLETLLIPLLETLYDAASRRSNQIYMVLIILLILSQDSSFNASIHKLILPTVPWYKERRLNQTSLGSLMVVLLIRTLKYNQSKLQDVYLHTNCLATLANMAPHVHHISAYASQQIVSLCNVLSRRYIKLAELKNDKMHSSNGELRDGDSLPDEMSSELHIYTDFLRIVLEILNVILTYALPRNPEVVYAILHRQEIFLPFKSHPRFNELVENIFTVLDFFNSRMDAQKLEGEWSVEKVLQIIIINCRSWRGEGMKMFTQLHFTYEQESHPEEFFIPYVWQLVLTRSGFSFNPKSINLFLVDFSAPFEGEISYVPEEADKLQNSGFESKVEVDQVV